MRIIIHAEIPENAEIHEIQFGESQRLVYTLFIGLELQEQSMIETLRTLETQSSDGVYKECYRLLQADILVGRGISSFFTQHKEYAELFNDVIFSKIKQGEDDGTLTVELRKLIRVFATEERARL